jgi:diguanylate cyclase (GGDEF)-like protein/PAS domain S-box-containing protein
MRIEAEANLSALIESTEDLIWSVDSRYRLITFNRAFSQYFEQSFGGPVAPGMGLRELLPPARAAIWPPFFDRALRGEKYCAELPLVDGRILELFFNPIIVDGKTTGVSVFGKDITEWKKSESAIKKAEANLTALIESTGDLIWSVDLDYRLTTFNKALQQNIQNNYGARIAAGMCFHEYLPPERAALWPPFYARVLAEGPFRVEYSRIDGGLMELAFNPIVVEGITTGISVFGKEITERKAAEESCSFLAEVVDSCEEAIITNAPSGEILTWNHGAEIIYGYAASEAIGKPFSMIIAPELRTPAGIKIKKLMEGAPLLEDEGVALRKDGSRIHVSVTTWPIRSSTGEVTAICTIVRDVSVRHEVEKAKALLVSVVESSSDAVHAVNLDGTVASWNRGAEALFGYTNEEMMGRSIAILAPPGRGQEVSSFMRIVAQGEHVAPFDTFLCNKNGRNIDVALSISPIRNLAGEVVGASAIARDISQRKRSERALQDAEKKYREIFEGALEGMCQTTLEGIFLSANPAVARMLGYESAEELIFMSKDLAEDMWVNPETRAQYLRQLEEHGAIRGFECQLKRKDGRHIWVSLNDRGVCGPDGRLLYFEGFMEDITDRKQAEAALRDSLASLQESQAIGGLGSYVLDIGTGVWTSSDVLDEIFGISKDFEHTVKGWTKLIHPDDRIMISAYFAEEVVGKGLDFNKEYRIIRQTDQAERWVHGIGRLEFGGKGQPVKMRGVIKDITESKLSGMQLRLSEERYRTAFQTSIDAININRIDDGRFIDCNQAFLDMSGYKREEIIGRTSLEVGIWADARDRQTMMNMLRQNSSVCGLEVQLRKKDGEIGWGQISASLTEIDGTPCVLSVTRDISAAKTAERTIRNLAFYDSLTGLPNRRHLQERLRQPLDASARGSRSQALLLVDLDHFKTLNDTLGHQAGDLLLQEVARRILACAHDADTVCRLGGDEFVVLLEDQSKVAEEAAAQAKAVGEKILAAIDQPFMIEDRECLSSASIGIAVFGDRQDSTDEILQQAEIALYQAKAAGRNTMRFFSPALQAAVNARATLEEDLRQGIKEKQFLLYYQPQMERGRLTGAEALIRWNHPRRGMVQPNDFIPLAEESRLILPLGDWVLEAACAQIALWAGRKETAHLSIAVNISALQFRQPTFVEQVLEILRRTGANPESLRLELTESMLVENLEDIIAKMTKLRSHGLRFSLDDFGTGYSSLTYLKRLPLDRLKIDRSFVSDMLVDATSGAIAQTILSLGRAMGISVIAEGVETEEQRGYLAGLGCHSFQGFLFSRPLPLDKFEVFLRGFTENGSPS